MKDEALIRLSDRLQAYADELLAAGFTVYVPRAGDRPSVMPGSLTWFTYSRIVNERECFGIVSQSDFGLRYEHSMPIKPSTSSGSSMVVGEVYGALSIEMARKVARPRNTGPWVGTHENYYPLYWLDRLYDKVVGTP
jgi:hypothetical protein